MKVDVSPFGTFQDYKLASHVTRQLAEGARVIDLHDALSAHGQLHWPGFRKGLWRRPAFAREKRIFAMRKRCRTMVEWCRCHRWTGVVHVQIFHLGGRHDDRAA